MAGTSGNREGKGESSTPCRRPPVISRRMGKDLEGERSPWKDRTSTRGNEGDVTDSSAEQGPEAGCPACARRARHSGNGVSVSEVHEAPARKACLHACSRCFGTVDGTRGIRRSHFGERGLRTLLGVNGEATDGGQMWGGALGLTGASGQGNRVPPRPSFGMDFLRYQPPLRGNARRWKDPG